MEKATYYALLEELKKEEHYLTVASTEATLNEFFGKKIVYNNMNGQVEIDYSHDGKFIITYNGDIIAEFRTTMLWVGLMKCIIKDDPNSRGIVALMSVAIRKAIDAIR